MSRRDKGVADVTTHPLVSVFTPVYNGAAYLEECIRSVLNQTYAHWEYTIVDNASTDETPEIAARFAARDARIRHMRFDEFVDVNENHNRGFRAMDAASEFCKIVQADDWIYPECLTLMVEAAQTSETIGIVTSYRLSDDGVDLVGLPYSTTLIEGRKILRRLLLDELVVVGGPTSMLLRSRFVRERDPFYENACRHADTESAFWMLSRHDLGFIPRVLTFERRQAGRHLDHLLRMNTIGPEFICFLLRYGRDVLEPDEYRRQLRLQLRRYAWWHVRQFPRPSRLRDPEFFAIHRSEAERILEAGGSDVEVRAALFFVRALLARGMWHSGPVSRRTDAATKDR